MRGEASPVGSITENRMVRLLPCHAISCNWHERAPTLSTDSLLVRAGDTLE